MGVIWIGRNSVNGLERVLNGKIVLLFIFYFMWIGDYNDCREIKIFNNRLIGYLKCFFF